MKYLIGLFFMALLTACGSGGGGGGGGSTSPSTPGGGSGGGGGSSGGNGNPAYYGFATDSSTPISNQSSPPATGTNQLTITSEVSINLRSLNNRTMDVTIYQPTCVAGVLTETYSAVLISGSNTSPTLGTIIVSATGISFTGRGVLSGVNMYDVGSTTSVSGTCTTGEMNLSSYGTLYSNGKLLLWKTGAGDLYMGALSSTIETVMANFQLRQYNKYEQINNGAVNPGNALSTWSSGTIGQITLDASASSSNSAFANSSGNTIVKGFASSSPNARYASCTNGYSISTNSHTRAWTNLSSDVPFYGFGVSSLGTSGKSISVLAGKYANGSTVSANNGTSVEDLKGAGSILIHIQN